MSIKKIITFDSIYYRFLFFLNFSISYLEIIFYRKTTIFRRAISYRKTIIFRRAINYNIRIELTFNNNKQINSQTLNHKYKFCLLYRSESKLSLISRIKIQKISQKTRSLRIKYSIQIDNYLIK